jgi:putative ABC transport system permease protein
MRAATFLVRRELRNRPRGLLVVVLLVGLAGGVTLAAFAGGRRTSTSFDRFLISSRAQDVLLIGPEVGASDVARIRAMPDVEGVGRARFLALIKPDGTPLDVGFAVAGPLDDRVFHDVFRIRIVRGRATAPGAAEELVIGEPMARANHLDVGDTLAVRGLTQADVDVVRAGKDIAAAHGPRVRLHIVGISRTPSDLTLQSVSGGVLIVPSAFIDKYWDRVGNFYGPDGGLLPVRLRSGPRGVDSFLARLHRELPDRHFDVDPVALSNGGVQESIDLLALAVYVFGAVAAVAGLIAIGMTTSRQVALLATSQRGLRDLGLPRRSRAAAVAGPVLVAVAIGAVVAVVTAWVASPLLPFGVARDADPDAGLHFDAFALGTGALAMFAVVAVLVSIAAWRSVRSSTAEARARRPSRLTRSLEATGVAPSATLGIRMALQPGRGRSAPPIRSALGGVGFAVLGVIVVAVFSASLHHLLSTPAAYGRAWDTNVFDERATSVVEGQDCGPVRSRLVADADVAAIANVCSQNITIKNRAVGVIGITPLRGAIAATVLAGRAPRRADEVGLGTDTMRALHLRLGDEITVPSQHGSERYRVVGRVIVPQLIDAQAIADGAVFTGGGLDRFGAGPGDRSRSLVVRFRPGVDQRAAKARLQRLGNSNGFELALSSAPKVPLEVQRLHEIDHVPDALAAFLAVLGAIAVGHLLVTSIRRQRRDFAVLKTMGFSRRQLAAAVASEASTVAAFGIVVGLALGTAGGATLWRAVAHRVGLVPSVDTPLVAILVLVVATVVVANLVAALPARAAARTPAAVILRAE